MVKISHLKIYFHSKIEKIFKIVGTIFMIWFTPKVVIFYGIYFVISKELTQINSSQPISRFSSFGLYMGRIQVQVYLHIIHVRLVGMCDKAHVCVGDEPTIIYNEAKWI